MKKTIYTLATLTFFSILFSSCGCSDKAAERETADTIEEAARQIEDAGDKVGESLGGALKEMGKAMEDLSGGEASGSQIDFRDLKKLLPEVLFDLERKSSEGSKTGFGGYKVSTAKAKYQNDKQKIEVELTDAGSLGSLGMGMASWYMIEIDKESDRGFERTIDYKGHKGLEKCNGKRCEFSLFVDKKIIMNIKGNNVDIKDLRKVADKIGIKSISNLVE